MKYLQIAVQLLIVISNTVAQKLSSAENPINKTTQDYRPSKRECQDKFTPNILSCISATGLNFVETSIIISKIEILPFPVNLQTAAFNSTVKTLAKCLCTKTIQSYAILHDSSCSSTSFYGQFLSYLCEFSDININTNVFIPNQPATSQTASISSVPSSTPPPTTTKRKQTRLEYGTYPTLSPQVRAALPEPSKQKRHKIGLAATLPYSILWNSSETNIFTREWSIRGQNAMIELAISQINNNTSILPDILVEMIPVNTWNPLYYNNNGDYRGALGYASLAAYEAMEKRSNSSAKVILAQGYDGKNNTFSNSIWSYYKIPFCGTTSSREEIGAFELSNKNSYPYFFRMAPDFQQQAKAIQSLLLHWNVTRIAVVYTTNERINAKKLIQVLSQKLLLLAIVPLPFDWDENSVFDQLRNSDARYFVLLAGNGNSVQGSTFIYHKAVQQRLAGSSAFVWISTNNILDTYYESLYGQGSSVDLRGLYYLSFRNIEEKSQEWTDRFNSLQDAWIQLYFADENSGLNFVRGGVSILYQTYDCTMSLLYGLDKYIKQNPNISTDFITSGGIAQYLQPEQFSKTGYQGITSDGELMLNSNGDLVTAFFFMDYIGNFGMIDEVGNIKFSRSPTFYGKNSPPWDGRIDQQAIQERGFYLSSLSYFIIATVGISICVNFFVFIIVFRTKHSIRRRCIEFTLISVTGCFFCYIGLFLTVIFPTTVICKAQIWFSAVGFGLINVALLSRELLVYFIFGRDVFQKKSRLKLFLQVFQISIPLIVIELVLVLIWHFVADYSVSYQTFSLDGQPYFQYLCTSKKTISSSTALGAIVTYNSALVASLAYFIYVNRNVMAEHNFSDMLGGVVLSEIFLIFVASVIFSSTSGSTSASTDALIKYQALFECIFSVVMTSFITIPIVKDFLLEYKQTSFQTKRQSHDMLAKKGKTRRSHYMLAKKGKTRASHYNLIVPKVVFSSSSAVRISQTYGTVFSVWKYVEFAVLQLGSRRWVQIQMDKENNVLCCCIDKNTCVEVSRGDYTAVILVDATSRRIFEFEFERNESKTAFLAHLSVAADVASINYQMK